ncbi:LysR family transcriptional regulator [Sediminicurvatus halobius]|uniref:LysR family transcriptional regulator n=1 Tax=Sediminicurvatus halobius TaxID=2182432 RepID=A0A2U2N4J9_9GAMM|nr:LysR family transcriptional regulator [Spiribacter halobius]PWG64030.1 LysR family transcriptional regulator [Spiribacter halobius]UEX76916.1 LysR family transcriptional regulator [Spiribacter halobius]
MSRLLNWDDLRLIGAIAEAGSLAGAARRLGVNHATVFRRLERVEGRLGVALFERHRDGYRPTAAGAEAADVAGRIAPEIDEVERRVVGQDLRPAGTVRITTTDALLFGIFSAIFAEFRAAYPEIALEVVVPSQIFSLSRREADIAIRPSAAPPESLVGRRIAVVEQAIYAAPDRAPAAGADLRTSDWVGPEGSMGYRALERWMTEQGLDAACRYRTDSTNGLFAAAREGIGLAVLPCYLGEPAAGLVRVGEPLPALALDLWLLTHPDLRATARVRAVLDFVAGRVRAGVPGLAAPV